MPITCLLLLANWVLYLSLVGIQPNQPHWKHVQNHIEGVGKIGQGNGLYKLSLSRQICKWEAISWDFASQGDFKISHTEVVKLTILYHKRLCWFKRMSETTGTLWKTNMEKTHNYHTVLKLHMGSRQDGLWRKMEREGGIWEWISTAQSSVFFPLFFFNTILCFLLMVQK